MTTFTKDKYQARKNDEAVKALRKLSEGIARGELDVEFVHLAQGLESGSWNFRIKLSETEKYGNRNHLSEI